MEQKARFVVSKTREICDTFGGRGAGSREEEAAHYCLNLDCPARKIENIIHFASRDAMNIDGMGESLIEDIYNEGFIEFNERTKTEIKALPQRTLVFNLINHIPVVERVIALQFFKAPCIASAPCTRVNF